MPSSRLSDGSMKYLCLLAILLNPHPPALVCIEEPETGMHPDLIPKIADLLVGASERCQLVVTTHSDMLVDALSERPDAVVVCEKHDGQTTMNRLNQKELTHWLDKYQPGAVMDQRATGRSPLVKAHIYLEGGGGKDLNARCREGFRKLLESCGFAKRMPKLTACGSRNSAYDDFKTAHAHASGGDYVALLVDSEDPSSGHRQALGSPPSERRLAQAARRRG